MILSLSETMIFHEFQHQQMNPNALLMPNYQSEKVFIVNHIHKVIFVHTIGLNI